MLPYFNTHATPPKKCRYSVFPELNNPNPTIAPKGFANVNIIISHALEIKTKCTRFTVNSYDNRFRQIFERNSLRPKMFHKHLIF